MLQEAKGHPKTANSQYNVPHAIDVVDDWSQQNVGQKGQPGIRAEQHVKTIWRHHLS